MRTERETTQASPRGTEQGPSTFRRFLSRITGVPSEYDPDEDPVITELLVARKRVRKLEQRRRDPSSVLEDAIFPRG